MLKLIRICIMIGLLMGGLAVLTTHSRVIYAQDPTIPTRTPVAPPTDPAPPASPTSISGGSNPPPAATSTPVPATQSTATATSQSVIAATATGTAAPGTIIATPLGGSEGAAAMNACHVPPAVVARDLILVHTGPGEDYPVIGSLPATEQRLISGRAEFAPWWQILFIATDPQLLGWVADSDVDELGDTGSVPLAAPPLINGIAPTPGALWQPTPLPPVCTPTPTPTATATVTASPTSTGTPLTTPATGGAGLAGTTETADLNGSAAEFSSQDSSVAKQAAEEADAAATSAAITGSSGASGASSLLVPLLGIALIAGGIVIALLSRNKPPAG